MGSRVSVPPGTNVLRALEYRGVEYLTIRPTRAVVILSDGILWVEAPEGRLESASTVELRAVDELDRADEAALVDRFVALMPENDAGRAT